ncbi:MAG: phosphodiester glycosidase family protein [Bacteroidales bacterium]|nr:phosphodiester glycosidase family protein [Bacteroidales bacterium]
MKRIIFYYLLILSSLGLCLAQGSKDESEQDSRNAACSFYTGHCGEHGAGYCMNENGPSDSLAFVGAPWQVTELGKGAVAMYARIPMFNSIQSVSVVRYPADKFRTEILHRPKDKAGKPSEVGKEIGASFMMNAGYFHVKELIPSVFFRNGKEILGHTHPTELYRVDGVFGFEDGKGHKMAVEHCPDSMDYKAVTRRMKSAMASGPLLILDGDIVVPELMGDKADGDNVSAMEKESKTGSKIRTHYTSAQFYDRRHPRTAIGKDDSGNIYLVVIDGRFKGSADGASIYETAYICHLLGMTDAINLDGGGSSALWTSTTGVISYPRDNKKFDHEGERSVPNLIAVF